MSLAKIHSVQKSQKDQGKCERCDEALPKGSAYLWFTVGFRSKAKHVRCTKVECFPKDSERESSKLASIYAAIEDADFNNHSDKERIEEAVHGIAVVFSEVAEEYLTASVNPNTGIVFNTDAEEKADTLESGASDLNSWTYDEEPEGCEDHEEWDENCDACQGSFADYIEEVRGAAREAINNAMSY